MISNVEYRMSSITKSNIKKSSIEKSKFESRESIKSTMLHTSLTSFFIIGLRFYLSIFVATGVYALLLKFLQKNSPHNVQANGGEVKGLLKNVKITALFLQEGFP